MNFLPNDKLQKITSKELNLSFDFQVESYGYRILKIKLNGMLRKLDFNDKFFGWFMEDLIYFLDKNRYARRWDYEQIYIYNIDSLKLGKNQQSFENQFKSISNFDLLVGK